MPDAKLTAEVILQLDIYPSHLPKNSSELKKLYPYTEEGGIFLHEQPFDIKPNGKIKPSELFVQEEANGYIWLKKADGSEAKMEWVARARSSDVGDSKKINRYFDTTNIYRDNMGE